MTPILQFPVVMNIHETIFFHITVGSNVSIFLSRPFHGYNSLAVNEIFQDDMQSLTETKTKTNYFIFL